MRKEKDTKHTEMRHIVSKSTRIVAIVSDALSNIVKPETNFSANSLIPCQLIQRGRSVCQDVAELSYDCAVKVKARA